MAEIIMIILTYLVKRMRCPLNIDQMIATTSNGNKSTPERHALALKLNWNYKAR